MNTCPDCGGILEARSGSIFGGEPLQQCLNCGALWDDLQLEAASVAGAANQELRSYFRKPRPGPQEEAEEFQLDQQEAREQINRAVDRFQLEEDRDEPTETQLTNEELEEPWLRAGTEDEADEEEEFSGPPSQPSKLEPRYVPLEDDQERYDDFDWGA